MKLKKIQWNLRKFLKKLKKICKKMISNIIKIDSGFERVLC